jgi:hypothetical protein
VTTAAPATGTTCPAGICTMEPAGAVTTVPAASSFKTPVAGSITLVTDDKAACVSLDRLMSMAFVSW